MKKLVIPFVLMAMLLSGCPQSTSIGIIGGADGPTSIIVSDKNGHTLKRPLRMIKVDGKLYYDTDEESEVTARCGTLDGNLTKAGKEYEIPQNNNECNFDGAEGYQNFSEVAKEVLINNEWVIFRLFDDPEQDMSIYKYCFYLKGRTKNAAEDAEIVVLTEDKDIDFNKFADSMLDSTATPSERQYKTTFRLFDDYEGITLYAKDVTNKGLTLVFEHFDDEIENEDFQTGDWYIIEKEENGNWKEVKAKQEDIVFNAIAYMIEKNSSTELVLNWEFLYGELPKGNYRVAKEVIKVEEPGDFEKEILYAYFSI